VVPTYSYNWKLDPAINGISVLSSGSIALIPLIPIVFWLFWADKNEKQIFKLSRSLGLKWKSIISASHIVISVIFNVLYLPAGIGFKIFTYHHSSILLLYIASCLHTFIIVSQCMFFWFTFELNGIYFYLIIYIL